MMIAAMFQMHANDIHRTSSLMLSRMGASRRLVRHHEQAVWHLVGRVQPPRAKGEVRRNDVPRVEAFTVRRQ